MDEKELLALFNERQQFIDKRQAELIKTAGQLEQILLREILKRFLGQLKTDRGLITFVDENITLTRAIDTIFDSFQKNEQLRIASVIVSDFSRLFKFNNNYYEVFTTDIKRFERIKARVQDVMRKKLGITDDGKIQPNGFLDQFIKDTGVRNDIKKATFKAVQSGQSIKDFTNSLELIITGNPAQNIDGSLTRYYKGFVYDSYQQFDRSNNFEFAKELQLRAFIYSGGLIERSRQFCIEKNNQVFVIEEADEWKDDPTLPRTVAERKSGTLVGYNPLIDMGRWNCRHMVRFISKELAISKRPELKDYFNQAPNIEKMMGKAKDAGNALKKITDPVVDKYDAQVTPINYKGRASILRKANDDYNGDVTLVKDTIRNTIFIDDPSKLRGIVNELKKSNSFLRMKEQVATIDKLGYSGFVLNFRLPNGTTAEIQVNTPEMIYAKEADPRLILGDDIYNRILKETGLEAGLGHQYYEEWRNLKESNEDDLKRMLELQALSVSYYNKFR